MKISSHSVLPRLAELSRETGVSVEKLAEVAGVDAAADAELDEASLARLQDFLDDGGRGKPIGGGGASAGGLLRMALEAGLSEKGGAEPPVLEPHLLEPHLETQPLRLEPESGVTTLGNLSGLAKWIDEHRGNNNGAIGVNELKRFARDYGDKPEHHAGIKGLAQKLGARTKLEDGHLKVVGGGKGGRSSRADRPGPASSNQAAQVAAQLVRRAGPVSARDEKKVEDIIASAPAAALEAMRQRGYKIFVCNVISDVRPDIGGQQGRGFPPGVTLDEGAAGLHDPSRREIYITKRGIKPHYVLHEVGHAFDHARRRPSLKNDFRSAYNAAKPALQRNREQYLLQPGEAGLSEAFADSFSLYNHAPDRAKLQRDYPSLYNYWRSREQAGWT